MTVKQCVNPDCQVCGGTGYVKGTYFVCPCAANDLKFP